MSGTTEGSLQTFESTLSTWLMFKTNLIVSFLSLHKATIFVSLWPSDARSLFFQSPAQLRFKSTSCMVLVLLSYSCKFLKGLLFLGSISFCNKHETEEDATSTRMSENEIKGKMDQRRINMRENQG